MRWVFGTLVGLAALIGVYIGSAVVSVRGLVGAVRAGDGAEILTRTDQPRLRHSLVDQIVTAYLVQIGQNRPVKPVERMVANTYGASIADALVSTMLTTEISPVSCARELSLASQAPTPTCCPWERSTPRTHSELSGGSRL
jgi:hypothetical protein